MSKRITWINLLLVIAVGVALESYASAQLAVRVIESENEIQMNPTANSTGDETLQIYKLNDDSQTYRIRGLNGTKLWTPSGGLLEEGAEVIVDGPKHLNIDLEGGSNTLYIYGITAWELDISTGNGNDTIRIWESHFYQSDVNIVTGSGDDELMFGEEIFNSNQFGGNVDIDTGAGFDFVGFPGHQTIAGNLSITTGPEADKVVMAGNYRYARGERVDDRRIVIDGQLTIDTDGGDDFVHLERVLVDFVYVYTDPVAVFRNGPNGGGHDDVYIRSCEVGLLEVDMDPESAGESAGESVEQFFDDYLEIKYGFVLSGYLNPKGSLDGRSLEDFDTLVIDKAYYNQVEWENFEDVEVIEPEPESD